MNLKEVSFEINKQHEKIEKLENLIEVAMKEISNLEDKKKVMLFGGNNYHLIETAKNLINTRGVKRKFGCGKTVECLNDCIKDFVNGTYKIRNTYFGCKDYSGWSCQREDHNYGYGPRHGSIVFSIGLRDRKHEFKEEEVNTIIWYLENLQSEEFRKNVLLDGE